LGIGSAAQYINVLVSTTSNVPWAVLNEACKGSDDEIKACAQSRGNLFTRQDSSTWELKGPFALGFEENLGYEDSGLYGYDTLTLGFEGAPALSHQVVTGILTDDFWIATLGIRPAAVNFTSVDKPIDSWLSALKNDSHIPSLSWGYTAGAQGQVQNSKNAFGSLTLGGYDASRFEPHDTKFGFGADISRDLLVGVHSISSNGSAFAQDPILSFLDAGTPHIWLPKEDCDRFATQFGLSYSDHLDLYVWNSTQYQQTAQWNDTKIDFVLGADLTGGSTVNISIPFTDFDLVLTSDYPGVNESTHYFPIRRAANNTQYTLGRAFLQHAYLIADYERQEFSVHQARFTDDQDQDLRAISSTSDSTQRQGGPTASNKITSGGIAGIAVAAVVAIAIIAFGVFVCCRRRKDKRLLAPGQSSPSKWAELAEVPANEKVELPSPHVPFFKRIISPRPQKLASELETSVAELEVPHVNHEVPAREVRVDRTSQITSTEVGSPHTPTSQDFEQGRKYDIHEMP
jgi:hypothetical protein